MYCTHCGKELEDGATFCTHCGAHLGDDDQPDTQTVDTSQTTSANERNSEPEKSSKGKAKWIIIGLSAAIVVVVAIILVLTLGVGTNNKAQTSASSTDSVTSAAPSSDEEDSSTSTNSKDDTASSTVTTTTPSTTTPSATTNDTSTVPTDSTSKNQTLPSSNPYAAYTSDYIIADSSTRTLSASSLAQYNAEQLKLARNEIFARKGRIFKDADLDAYFRSKQWYSPSIEPDTFDANTSNYLSEVERDNAGTIIEYEKANGMPT